MQAKIQISMEAFRAVVPAHWSESVIGSQGACLVAVRDEEGKTIVVPCRERHPTEAGAALWGASRGSLPAAEFEPTTLALAEGWTADHPLVRLSADEDGEEAQVFEVPEAWPERIVGDVRDVHGYWCRIQLSPRLAYVKDRPGGKARLRYTAAIADPLRPSEWTVTELASWERARMSDALRLSRLTHELHEESDLSWLTDEW